MEEEDEKMLEEYQVDLEQAEDSGDEGEAEMALFTARCSRAQQAYAQKAYTMYHGTTMDSAHKIKQGGFKQSPDGMLGRGVYVSRSFEKARRYPLQSGGKKLAVLKLKVRVGKVKKIDYQGHPMQKTWHCYGYDTAWVPPNCGMTPSGLEEDCVYDPHRIKVLDILPNRR